MMMVMIVTMVMELEGASGSPRGAHIGLMLMMMVMIVTMVMQLEGCPWEPKGSP